MSLVPNLKTMSSLQMDLSQEYDLALITDVRILLPPKLGHQQYLPRNWECLRHLILNGDLKFDNSGTIFKVMDCCPYTLNSLSVSGLWVQKLPEFLERLRRHDLERLNLIITCDRSNPQSDYFLQQHDTLPVRSVDLTFVDKAGRGTELWAQWLIDMLAVSMPYIEDLLLQISSLPLAVVTSLAKLPLLRRLEIHGDILWRKASASTCLLAAVETFVYYGRQFPHDLQLPGHSLHPLSLPNLVNCTLGTRLNKDRKGRRVPPHATLLPRLSNTSLVRLHVRLPNGPTPSLRELPCLEELAMGDPLDMVTKYPVWQSNILEQLIAEPKVCRHLRKLEFYSPYAEWDILILALERRNFLGDATIRLIDEIDFKFAQPSSKLLTPISSLLAGIFVERQPLHEYSFMAIAKNFSSDSSTHSCLACLATFKGETDDGAGAGDPAFGQVDDEDGQDMESFLTSADPPLSESVCLWLAKKGSRYQTARMLIEDAEEDGKQLTRCPEHRSMKVTGSSSWHNAYLDMDEE
ncbi:hypothetical protein FRC17_011325 [Serendipita sp. 399]|nr:hypothetical protein FRC17_011325 [Serendipita sp. 399]